MIDNHEKVTAAFCAESGPRGLVFFPKTPEEVELITSRLSSFGYALKEKQTQDRRAFSHQCMAKGLLLLDGEIQYNTYTLKGMLRCTVSQLSDDYMPPQERLMQDLFNKLSARQDALEAKLDQILELLSPPSLAKFPARKP